MSYDRILNTKGPRETGRVISACKQIKSVTHVLSLTFAGGLGRPNSVGCAHMEPLNNSRALTPLIENITKTLRNGSRQPCLS